MSKNFGTYNRMYKIGKTLPTLCPKCNNEAEFQLVKIFNSVKVFIPVGEYSTTYHAVCPKCASVYNIDAAVGEELEESGRQEKLSLDISMLTSNKLR